MADVSQIRPLRWLGRLVLGIVGLYLLTQVIGRVMRRLRPGLTPLQAIPSLNMPLRWKFFFARPRHNGAHIVLTSICQCSLNERVRCM